MSNIKVGLVIGAALESSFSSAFDGAEKTILKIGKTTEQLTQRQQRMGQILNRALSHPTRSLVSLKRHYDQIGQALANVNSKQTQYNTALAKQKQLTEQRKKLIGQATVKAADAYANARLIIQSVGSSANFNDALKDISIKGGLNKNAEIELGKVIRESALQTNQDVSILASGVGVLIKNGALFDEAKQYVSLLGQVITGVRTSQEESSAAFLSLRDMGVKNDEEMLRALNQLVWSGQQGAIGADGMIVAIGQLNDEIKKHKLGLNSLGDIAATLQIGDATMGSGNTLSALKSWLDEMGSHRRAEAYKNVGVDYKASMGQAVKDGFSEFEASMRIATLFLESKVGKSGIEKLKTSNSAELESLADRLGLSEVFKDSNQIQLVLGYLQNQSQYNKIKQGVDGNSSVGALQHVFDSRMSSPEEKIKALGLSIKELSMSLGDALLPAVMAIIHVITPIVNTLGLWIKSNPKLTAGIIGLATAMIGFNVVMLTTNAALLFFVKTPLAGLGVALAKTSLTLDIFKAKLLLGGAAITKFSTFLPKLGTSIASVGRILTTVSRAFIFSPIGAAIAGIALAALLIYKYWQPIKAFFGGVFDGISEALSPVTDLIQSTFSVFAPIFKPLISLFETVWSWCKQLFEPFEESKKQLIGATSAGRTFGKVLGTVFDILLTPLKIIFTLIGWMGKAIQAVFNWSPVETIKTTWDGVAGFFGNIWEKIKSICSDAITGISHAVLNWSPLGLFYKAFSGVLGWFSVELPTAFADAGSKLIDGLVNGITKKWNTVKETVVGLGSSVTDWFKDKLGIHSPSRVFIGLGENISEGAALGINHQTDVVNRAVTDLVNIPLNRSSITPINRPTARNIAMQNQSTDSMVVNFSPNITVNGNTPNIRSQITDAVKLSFEEFERLMKQYQHRTQRVAYKGINS